MIEDLDSDEDNSWNESDEDDDMDKMSEAFTMRTK